MANEPRFEVYPRKTRPGTGRRLDPADQAWLDQQMADRRDNPDEGLPPSQRFGWRFRAANGEISAIGGEGFTRREDAHRAIRQFASTLADLLIEQDERRLVISDAKAIIVDADE